MAALGTPMRRMKKLMAESTRFALFSVGEGLSWYRRHGRLPHVSEISYLTWKAVSRFRILMQRTRSGPKTIEPMREPYEAWLSANRWTRRMRDDLIERLHEKSSSRPMVSIIMPVHDPPVPCLDRAIASVREQVCDRWELCIIDDCSGNHDVRETLRKWTAQDDRIKTTFLDRNVNISTATNEAVKSSTGQFLLFMDHDDELTPDAVGEVALYLAEHPETDVLYSDDDKIDLSGNRYAPQFKPDWSPELLLSYMYFSHLFVIRRALFDACGGMRVGFEGSQDYDLALRATEKSSAIGHIPKILYHWRAVPGSTATSVPWAEYSAGICRDTESVGHSEKSAGSAASCCARCAAGAPRSRRMPMNMPVAMARTASPAAAAQKATRRSSGRRRGKSSRPAATNREIRASRASEGWVSLSSRR